MSAEDIANAFLTHYYTTFDTAPAGLAGLYQPQSTLTFEGAKSEGPAAIVQKFASLGPVQHNVAGITKDVQMSITGSAMLIFVTGHLRIGEGNPLHFSHVFQLVATGPGAYYVHNEIFRLIYG